MRCLYVNELDYLLWLTLLNQLLIWFWCWIESNVQRDWTWIWFKETCAIGDVILCPRLRTTNWDLILIPLNLFLEVFCVVSHLQDSILHTVFFIHYYIWIMIVILITHSSFWLWTLQLCILPQVRIYLFAHKFQYESHSDGILLLFSECCWYLYLHQVKSWLLWSLEVRLSQIHFIRCFLFLLESGLFRLNMSLICHKSEGYWSDLKLYEKLCQFCCLFISSALPKTPHQHYYQLRWHQQLNLFLPHQLCPQPLEREDLFPMVLIQILDCDASPWPLLVCHWPRVTSLKEPEMGLDLLFREQKPVRFYQLRVQQLFLSPVDWLIWLLKEVAYKQIRVNPIIFVKTISENTKSLSKRNETYIKTCIMKTSIFLDRIDLPLTFILIISYFRSLNKI